jgi:hypothetical protein
MIVIIVGVAIGILPELPIYQPTSFAIFYFPFFATYYSDSTPSDPSNPISISPPSPHHPFPHKTQIYPFSHTISNSP